MTNTKKVLSGEQVLQLETIILTERCANITTSRQALKALDNAICYEFERCQELKIPALIIMDVLGYEGDELPSAVIERAATDYLNRELVNAKSIEASLTSLFSAYTTILHNTGSFVFDRIGYLIESYIAVGEDEEGAEKDSLSMERLLREHIVDNYPLDEEAIAFVFSACRIIANSKMHERQKEVVEKENLIYFI